VDNIRESIYQYDTSLLGISTAISASFGLSFINSGSEETNKVLTTYIIEADTALYQAKASGRNQLSIFQ